MSKTVIHRCIKCGDLIETDATWKNVCYKCWLKKAYPERYKKQYEICDIICARCGIEFSDVGWKTMCPGCWLIDKQEKIDLDLEEREQYK